MKRIVAVLMLVMLGLLLLTVNAIVKAVDKRKLAKSKEGIA